MTETTTILASLAVATLAFALVADARTAAILAAGRRERLLGVALACGLASAALVRTLVAVAGLILTLTLLPGLAEAVRGLGVVGLAATGAATLVRAVRAAPLGTATTETAEGRAAYRAGALAGLVDTRAFAFELALFASLGVDGLGTTEAFAAALVIPAIGLAWTATIALAVATGPLRLPAARPSAPVARPGVAPGFRAHLAAARG